MKIAILPGDGIGPEIVEQAVQVLNALGEHLKWKRHQLVVQVMKPQAIRCRMRPEAGARSRCGIVWFCR
jgi:isocitrate/isopropylmalate dehydrogenase